MSGTGRKIVIGEIATEEIRRALKLVQTLTRETRERKRTEFVRTLRDWRVRPELGSRPNGIRRKLGKAAVLVLIARKHRLVGVAGKDYRMTLGQ